MHNILHRNVRTDIASTRFVKIERSMQTVQYILTQNQVDYLCHQLLPPFLNKSLSRDVNMDYIF